MTRRTYDREAVAGMILNGWAFDRPLSLTPQFFANKPVALLFRAGVSAEHFNRFKLGRSLDKGFAYGCDTLFSEVALAVCQQEGVALKFNCLDTTSFSLTGAYVPETDTQAIAITHGYSKDHRPDLKQAVLELIVFQDGECLLARIGTAMRRIPWCSRHAVRHCWRSLRRVNPLGT